MTPIVAFVCVAVTFALGDFIALKTKGVVSTFITAIVVFLLFGSVLKVLPGNLMELSGLTSLIPTFGMVLILTNLGSTLDLNELKKEWRTILVSLAGVVGIVMIGFTLGQLLFGREKALSSIAPISGGIVATMISSDAANAAGRPDIAAYAASVTALQMLVGLPISSFCLKKAALHYIEKGLHKTDDSHLTHRKNFRLLPQTPKTLNMPTVHFARLAAVGALAQIVSTVSGINNTICFLLFGAVAGAIGVVEKNSLKEAGGDGVMLLATYAYVSASFLTMTLSQFASMLIPIFGMLILGAVGIFIFSGIMGLVFHWDPYLSIATGLSCMFGYPVTYAVSMEVVNGTTLDGDFTESEIQNITNYVLPKMLIAGVTSVSVASVVLAGIIAPMIFH